MSQPLTPLADRVIACREEAATRTASGLYLPNTTQEKTLVAVVQAVGPQAKSGLKKGDRIVYKEYSTTEVRVNGKDYLILSEEDVLATVSGKQ